MGTYTTPDNLYKPSVNETGWGGAVDANFDTIQARLLAMDVLARGSDLVYNVKAAAYGAVGNDIADDTTAINAAITAAGTTGVVFFPPGTYKVTGLTVSANSRLVGSGARVSALALANSANLPVLRFTTAVTQAYVGHLGIDGNKTNNTSPGGSGNQGIACEGAERLTVEHCRIFNTYSNGIEVAEGNYCRILNNEITGAGNTTTSGSAAIRLFGNSSVRSNDNLIQGNYLDGNVSGIYLIGDTTLPMLRNQILGNIVVNCTGTSPAFGQDGGIAAANGQHDLVIADNVVSGNTGRGIHVFGECKGIVIQSNTVRDCGVTNQVSGIDVGDNDTDSGYLVSHNYVEGSGAAGIYITSNRDSSFIGNVLKNNGKATALDVMVRAGIVMNDSTGAGTYPVQDNIISGNRCYDTQGTKTQKYGINQYTGGASSYLRNQVIGNNVRDNATAGIRYLSETDFYHANQGFNPPGIGAITVTASPFTYTNKDCTSIAVYIFGGTVSQIAKDSVNLFTSTDKTVWLQPQEAVVVTYSAAPTMKKDLK
jgi:parallel beta-helix repeat protein